MPVQSTRKLIRMGRDGLVVTVPRAWAAYYKLKAGDKVSIIANDDLTIHPLTQSEGGDSEKAQ